jgi:hypothetical protein
MKRYGKDFLTIFIIFLVTLVLARDAWSMSSSTLLDIVSTADNDYDLYVDGNLIMGGNEQWETTEHTSLSLLPGEHAVAVEAWDWGVIGGFLGTFRVGGEVAFNTDSSWKVTADTPPEGWKELGFDDSAWLPATEVPESEYWYWDYPTGWNWPDSGLDTENAQWIWTDGYLGATDERVFFRRMFCTPCVERISADTVGTVFNPDAGDGLGRITFSQETPIEIDWDNGMTEVVEDGSIVLWVDLSEDTSEDGLASGHFEEGEFAIWGDEGEELLTGEVDWLMMEELFDGMGIMGGAGRIIVTGGELMDSFGTMGEVVDITFNIDPRDIEDFGIAFTGESNITLQPVIPEPASIILAGAALAGIAALARKRLSMKSN